MLAPLLSVGPTDDNMVTVPAVRFSVVILAGELADKTLEMMLAASLVMTQEGDNLKQYKLSNAPKFILIIAPGAPLLITRCILGSSRSSIIRTNHC